MKKSIEDDDENNLFRIQSLVIADKVRDFLGICSLQREQHNSTSRNIYLSTIKNYLHSLRKSFFFFVEGEISAKNCKNLFADETPRLETIALSYHRLQIMRICYKPMKDKLFNNYFDCFFLS